MERTEHRLWVCCTELIGNEPQLLSAAGPHQEPVLFGVADNLQRDGLRLVLSLRHQRPDEVFSGAQPGGVGAWRDHLQTRTPPDPPHWSECTTSVATMSTSSTRCVDSPKRSAAAHALRGDMTLPRHCIGAYWPAERSAHTRRANWLPDRPNWTRSASSSSSNPPSGRPPSAQVRPAIVHPLGRFICEAATQALVGSSI